MRQLKVRLLALGLALSVGGSLLALMIWAMSGVYRADAARHREVGERLIDAMEAELSELVSREERRSFLEYRAYYLPEQSQKLGNVMRSPLAETPKDPFITGYFQRDPDGTVHSPSIPRDCEVDLASEEGWEVAPAEKVKLDALERTVAGLRPFEGPAPTGTPGVARRRSPRPGSLSKLRSIGSQKRSSRRTTEVAANTASLAIYNAKDVQIQQAYTAPVVEVVPPGDVRVSPLQGRREGKDQVLYRTVEMNGTSTVQGFIVDLEALAAAMQTRVVVATSLEDYVHLSWTKRRPPGRWLVHHRFAAPFQSLELKIGVDRIPGVTSIEGSLLWGLVFSLSVVLFLVGGALVWAVRTELAFAQRRSDFVAAVSHELKTPLTSIRMYAEMLRDGMVPDADRQRVYHATITSEAERLTRLINNVLELSRLERASPRADPVPGDLRSSVNEAVKMLRPHAVAQGVELLVDLPELPPVLIEADALVQVVMNLVDNAIKFGGEGIVSLTAREEKAWIILKIHDHGPGVPARQLRHIFEPFYRGERELTRTTKGTGIGLALVRGLLAGMGGTVRARNHPEGGLEVTIRLQRQS